LLLVDASLPCANVDKALPRVAADSTVFTAPTGTVFLLGTGIYIAHQK
jgi:hypothetical protein